MAARDAGEAFLEDLLAEDENPPDGDEDSITSANDFLDDDARDFSTQTIPSCEDDDIYGGGERRAGDGRGGDDSNEGAENGVVDRYTSAVPPLHCHRPRIA